MKCLAILLLAFATNAFGLDLTLTDGTTFKDIWLRSIDSQGIIFRYSEGVAGVDYMKMTESDRLTFGYIESKYVTATTAKTTPVPPAPVTPPKPVASQSYTPPAASKPAQSTYSSPSYSQSSGQCAATTKKGYRCSRNAKAGSSYCWQHGG